MFSSARHRAAARSRQGQRASQRQIIGKLPRHGRSDQIGALHPRRAAAANGNWRKARECNQKREGKEKLGMGLGTWGPRITSQRHRLSFARPTTSSKRGADKPSCLHPADACRLPGRRCNVGAALEILRCQLRSQETLPWPCVGAFTDGRRCACTSPWAANLPRGNVPSLVSLPNPQFLTRLSQLGFSSDSRAVNVDGSLQPTTRAA